MQKTVKRILAYVLTLAILLSSLVFGAVTSVSAEDVATIEVDVWDGTKAESFAGGDGSAATPYLIETPEQLYKMLMEFSNATASNGVYFEITKDIYLNDVADGTHVKDLETKENWLKEYGTSALPNGSTTNAFAGSLNGNGHTIYGLYTSGAGRSGLFHTIIQGTVIKNLSFENVYLVDGKGYGGAIAGRAHWVTGKSYAQIVNCSVTNAVIGGDMEYSGGLIGNMTDCNTDFKNCYSYNVTLSNWESRGLGGGMFGNINASSTNKVTFTNCYSAGNFPVNSKVNKTGGSITFTNTYTDVAVPEGNSETDVTVLTDDKMKGDAAKTNMSLDYRWTFKLQDNAYPVFQDEIIEVWDGSSRATSFDQFKGEGTAENPYKIENAAQLAYVVATKGLPKKKYYELVKDIRINDTTIPNWKEKAKNWVWEDFRFEGTVFEGNGHTIDGLFFNNYAKDKQGLFSYVGDTTIKNLYFTNASVSKTGGYGAGIVAGQTSASANFENIYVDETCEINAPTTQGVAAISSYSTTSASVTVNITNCAVLATITGKSSVGAFLGHYTMANDALTVKNSFSAVAGAALSGKQTLKSVKNAYALVGDSYGTVGLDAENMKGENAKTYMPTLSYKYIWEITDSYPVLNVRGEIWNGSVASSYDDFEGNGTAADPYIIKNGAQLAFAVSKNSNLTDGSYFKLANDIILNDASNEGWEAGATPWLWNNHARFNGTLDGDGHTIEGLYINTSSTNGRLGLFAYIGKTTAMDKVAEVKNLTFTGASVNSTATSKVEGISIIAGQTSGHTVFENVYIDETCEINAPDTAIGVGSFAGRGYQNEGGVASAYITNCATLATINASTETSNAVGSFTGSYWTDASVVEINNSFTTINRPLSGDKRLTNSANNIGLVSYDNSTRVVDVENMKGLDANIHMAGLNFNQVWKTVENGYPVLTDEAYRADFWDGTSADGFAGGEGTEANPYMIENANQLYYLATLGTEDTAGKFFKLANNIVISNVRTGWENESPYAWAVKDIDLEAEEYSNTFAGTLDGAGYTVSGIYFADFSYAHNNDAFGLLPSVSANAVIKNLTVSGAASSVTNSEYVGAVAGSVYLTPAEATNKLNKVHFVGVNLENSNLAVIGRGVTASKFDLCNADVFSAVNGANAVTRNCNASIAYTDDVIICNANTVNDGIKTTIRMILLGLDNSYVADVNGDGDFDICDLVATEDRFQAEVQ